MAHDSHQPHQGAPRDYEDRDIRLSAIVKFTIYIVLFTIATFWGARVMLQRLVARLGEQETGLSPFAQERVLPPEPRLLPDEQRTLEAQRAAERELLETYGWVDEAHGVVRIPVERAMELVLERGLPARETK
jgi:hypothetical protein